MAFLTCQFSAQSADAQEVVLMSAQSPEPHTTAISLRFLKGQKTDARPEEMDFVVKGVMIGGFALVAAPVEYGQTGVKTFIVSHDRFVHEKILGSAKRKP